MPNANRAAGDRAEREVIKILEAEGYYTTRSAGSLGDFDIIALGGTRSLAVQVKTSKLLTSLKSAMKKAASIINSYALDADIEIWGKLKGRGRIPAKWIIWRLVDGIWVDIG